MIMNSPTVFLIFTLISIIEIVDSRIYYIDDPPSYTNNPAVYYTADKNNEKASKNLDMSFSAGDPTDTYDNIIYSPRMDYISTAVPVSDLNRENSIYLYKRPLDVPISKKIIYTDDSSLGGWERKPNLLKFNNKHTGEVILELRVIANNNEI